MIKGSIIIPVHNESESLERFLDQFLANIGEYKNNIAEILLMENGSTDSTFQVCKKLERKYPDLIKPHRSDCASYGEAIKSGMLIAKSDFSVILESDVMDNSFFKTSVEIFSKKDVDFIVASKRHTDSEDKRPLKRRMLTFLFNMYLKIFFNFKGTDTHGLKSIKDSIAKELCKKAITSDEVFQTEIVLLAYKLGYSVIEVPLSLSEKRGTPVSILKRFPKVFNIISQLNRSISRFK